MSTEERSLAILGMRDAGKTTYIARLWLGVHEKIGRLHAVGLPQAFKPLRDLSGYLLRSKYPDHTVMGDQTSFAVPLKWAGRKHDVPFTLSFTDYSGEELEGIFKHRDAGWSDVWKARSTKSLGLLLFLRPNKIILPMSNRLAAPSADFDAVGFRHLQGESAPELAPQPLAAEDPALLLGTEYQPEEAEEAHRHPHPDERVHPPTVVALVETLQFLRHERGLLMGEAPDPERFRIAVVVSCWDQVPNDVRNAGPEQFVKLHFPMLYDFLGANFDATGVRTFGVSSTGGDLTRKVYRDEYDALEPARVGEVVYHPTRGGSVKKDSDITLPIGWLLEGESALPDADTA